MNDHDLKLLESLFIQDDPYNQNVLLRDEATYQKVRLMAQKLTSEKHPYSRQVVCLIQLDKDQKALAKLEASVRRDELLKAIDHYLATGEYIETTLKKSSESIKEAQMNINEVMDSCKAVLEQSKKNEVMVRELLLKYAALDRMENALESILVGIESCASSIVALGQGRWKWKLK